MGATPMVLYSGNVSCPQVLMFAKNSMDLPRLRSGLFLTPGLELQAEVPASDPPAQEA
jgi:hypothetical protein